jgi:hypothetical protein
MLAVSTGVAVAYGVAICVLVFAPALVTALKGHWLLFAAGWLVIGVVWMIAAFRLARPESWWARRFYDEGKLARSRTRYA